MKKNKKNWTLVFVTIIFGILGFTLLKQSYNMKVPDTLNYKETGNVDYKVYLTDSKYYNKKFLDQGMQYISSIIDYVDINFKYDVKFDKKIDYDVKTSSLATIKIVDSSNNDRVIYSSKENLTENKINKKNNTSISTSENIKIDYQKYNKITNEFKTNYGINANCKLIVDYYIQYFGNYNNFNNINKSQKLSVEIPLSEQMININKTENFVNNLQYVENSNQTIANKTLLIVSILFIVISIVNLILIIKEIIIGKKYESKYDKYLRKILRNYDSYITESEEEINTKDKTVINIKSFKELLDVRNNIEKAIIYNKIDDNNSRFLIIDDNELYCYNLNSKDFE